MSTGGIKPHRFAAQVGYILFLYKFGALILGKYIWIPVAWALVSLTAAKSYRYLHELGSKTSS